MTWSYPLARSLPGSQRTSTPALLMTAVMHLALLWLALQSAPVVQTARSVVHYLAPITLLPQKPLTPAPKRISVPQPVPVRPLRALPEPVLPEPVVTAPKAIELPPEIPVTPKLQAVVPAPVEPVALPVPQEPVVPQTPAPVPLPVPPKPKPEPVPVPVLEPLPAPVPAATPAPAAPAAPAPTPTPAAVAVPAAAPAPTAALPRPAAITPVEQAPAAPQPAGPAGGQGAAGAVKPLTGLYPNMYNPSRQRSLSELANEQLNGGRRRDPLAEGVGAAEIPDCISPNAGGSLFGLVTIPIAAATGKCKLSK